MARIKKENPSMWERTEYDIISEEVTENGIMGIIRNRYNGAVIECHIPEHTKEECEDLTAELTYALIQTVLSGEDISCIGNMEITI